MVRKALVVATCALALAGCGDRSTHPMQLRSGPNGVPYVPPPDINITEDAPAVASPVAQPAAQQFSYTHSWTLRMPHGSVSPRFQRARDLCLQDKALACKLVSANISQGTDPAESTASASLEVQLPHAGLAPFEHALMAPVHGEKPQDAVMVSRQTQAQSVETQASDTGRKVAQLTGYRDRLAALEKRPDLRIDDLIKLEGEAARVQGELDAATSQQRTLTDGIAREDVSIQLNETTETVEPVGPIAQAWHDGGETLAENTASALRFVIGAVPWLPVAAAGLYFIAWLWRLFRRRQKASLAPG